MKYLVLGQNSTAGRVKVSVVSRDDVSWVKPLHGALVNQLTAPLIMLRLFPRLCCHWSLLLKIGISCWSHGKTVLCYKLSKSIWDTIAVCKVRSRPTGLEDLFLCVCFSFGDWRVCVNGQIAKQ